MTPDSRKQKTRQEEPPGKRLKQLASSSRALETILSQMHVLQIVDDHQALWFDAEDPAEKARIEARLRRQLRLAGVNFVGFETAVHGVVTAFISDPLHGGSLIVLGIALMYAAIVRGGMNIE